VNLHSHYHLGRLIRDAERRLCDLMHVKKTAVVVLDKERNEFIRLKNCPENLGEEEEGERESNQEDEEDPLTSLDQYLQPYPRGGLASIAMERKKVMLVTEPLSYIEYDRNIDIDFEIVSKTKPIICVPIMDREQENVEGCMEIEFKRKNYLSGNPLHPGYQGDRDGYYKLDVFTKEVLEIFSNQLRVAIEKVKHAREFKQRLVEA